MVVHGIYSVHVSVFVFVTTVVTVVGSETWVAPVPVGYQEVLL